MDFKVHVRVRAGACMPGSNLAGRVLGPDLDRNLLSRVKRACGEALIMRRYYGALFARCMSLFSTSCTRSAAREWYKPAEQRRPGRAVAVALFDLFRLLQLEAGAAGWGCCESATPRKVGVASAGC